MRKPLDISAYLVIGPENTLGRPVGSIVEAAISELKALKAMDKNTNLQKQKEI
mgnify:CR=1 FL=1